MLVLSKRVEIRAPTMAGNQALSAPMSEANSSADTIRVAAEVSRTAVGHGYPFFHQLAGNGSLKLTKLFHND